MTLMASQRYLDPQVVFRASPDEDEGDQNTSGSQGGGG